MEQTALDNLVRITARTGCSCAPAACSRSPQAHALEQRRVFERGAGSMLATPRKSQQPGDFRSRRVRGARSSGAWQRWRDPRPASIPARTVERRLP